MALSESQSGPRPQVFLSFAGEDVEWKRTLMKPTWWAALTRVADIQDYDNKPTQIGDLCLEMREAVEQSSAFIVILSRFYIQKNGVIEHEFTTAARRFSAFSNGDRLFCPIIVDLDAQRWWDQGAHPVFAENPWLRKAIYWPLMEENEPALLTGDLEPRYARRVREYAETLAKRIAASRNDLIRPPPGSPSIIVLGHPKLSVEDYSAAACQPIVATRAELVAGLRGRGGRVDEWPDGWFRETGPNKEARAAALKTSVKAIVRPLGSDEADDAAISPGITTDQLAHVAGLRSALFDASKLKVTLWLPSSEQGNADARNFLDKCQEQSADANPHFYVGSPRDLVEFLIPSGRGTKVTQISMEELDDREMIQNGRTAREIVEEEVKSCVLAGASLAKIASDKPIVRHFINHKGLASQISEAKDGRIILVAHDLTEHPAANSFDAHRILGRKVRQLTDSVESVLRPIRDKLIPITIVVTNFSLLRNDLTLDEEIAGLRWRLLPGQLDRGKFTPEPDIHRWLVSDIAKVLQNGELAHEPS